MDTTLQNKISDLLKTATGFSSANVFYLKSDVKSDVLPRLVFFPVSDVKNYDTEDEYADVPVQISLFCKYNQVEVTSLKTSAKEIQDLMTIANLGGTHQNYVSRCKLAYTRESEFQGVFQMDIVFKLSLTRKTEIVSES